MSNDDVVLAALRSALDPHPGRLAALAAGLAEQAGALGLVDVSVRTVDTPVGRLLLAATTEGLVRVAYESEGHDRVLQDLATRIGPRVLEAPAALGDAARQVDEYFAGDRRVFDLRLDWRLTAGFREAVLRNLPRIGFGATATYAAVASLAGRPRAVRAVGTACATNPLPVVVPCHRVVRSDGGLGGYLGGTEAKRLLLSLEGME